MILSKKLKNQVLSWAVGGLPGSSLHTPDGILQASRWHDGRIFLSDRCEPEIRELLRPTAAGIISGDMTFHARPGPHHYEGKGYITMLKPTVARTQPPDVDSDWRFIDSYGPYDLWHCYCCNKNIVNHIEKGVLFLNSVYAVMCRHFLPLHGIHTKDQKIQVGDTVQLIKHTEIHGYGFNWNENMNPFVGKVGTVKTITIGPVMHARVDVGGHWQWRVKDLIRIKAARIEAGDTVAVRPFNGRLWTPECITSVDEYGVITTGGSDRRWSPIEYLVIGKGGSQDEKKKEGN